MHLIFILCGVSSPHDEVPSALAQDRLFYFGKRTQNHVRLCAALRVPPPPPRIKMAARVARSSCLPPAHTEPDLWIAHPALQVDRSSAEQRKLTACDPIRLVVLLLPQSPKRCHAGIKPRVAVGLMHPVGITLEPHATTAIGRLRCRTHRHTALPQATKQIARAPTLLTNDDRPQSAADMGIESFETSSPLLSAQPKVAVPAA